MEPAAMPCEYAPPGGGVISVRIGRLAIVGGRGWRALAGRLTWPVMLLKGDALQHNIDLMARFCAEHGLDLAPHGKTTTAPHIVHRQLEAGAWGVTAATATQARLFHAFGVPRIMIANELLDVDAVENRPELQLAGVETFEGVIGTDPAPATVREVDGYLAWARNVTEQLMARDAFVGRDEVLVREGEKLVETIPNKGARVASLSTDDVRSAYEARIVLQVEALRRAHSHLTEQDLGDARELANEMVEQFQQGNDVAGYDLHRQLHFSLYEPSGSNWILHFISLMWDHTERYRRLATQIRHDPERIGHEHLVVLEALERGDESAALAALQAHLEHSAEILISAWTTDEVEQEA